MTIGLHAPALHRALRNRGATEEVLVQVLLDKQCTSVAFERGRLFTPIWNEAYVDFNAVLCPSAMAALTAQGAVVYDDTCPAAFACQPEGGAARIFLSTGLLELVTFAGFHVAASDRVAQAVPDIEAEEAREALYLQVVQGIVERSLPVPGVMALVTKRTYSDVAIHREIMTVFLLLHELGHVVLGHLEGADAGVIDFAPVMPDRDSPSHRLELEADAFACDSFANPFALHIASTFWSTWSLVETGRRVVAGREAHLSDTHPLSVNRMNLIVEKLLARTHPDGPIPVEGLMKALKRAIALLKRPKLGGLAPVVIDEDQIADRHALLAHQYMSAFERFA